MARGDIAITVDIEPIVKLFCKDTECKYNTADWLKMGGKFCCALKYVAIDEEGKCELRQHKDKA